MLDDFIYRDSVHIQDAKHLREVLDKDIFKDKTARHLALTHNKWQLGHYTNLNHIWDTYMDGFTPCNCPQSAVLTNLIRTYDDLLQNLFETQIHIMTRLWQSKTDKEKDELTPYLETLMNFVKFLSDICDTMKLHYYTWRDGDTENT